MYQYETERKELFTEAGSVTFMKIRDNTHALLKTAGAARMDAILRGANVTGSSWTMLACVDRLVELKEIREITPPNCAGQYRVFVEAY